MATRSAGAGQTPPAGDPIDFDDRDAVGAALPLVLLLISPLGGELPIIGGGSLLCLGGLGTLAARAGGARPLVGALRVVFWGALAMALTAAIGALFNTTPA